MNLVHYEPWSALRRFQRDVDHALKHDNPTRDHWVPAIDILEKSDRFELLVDVPGVDPDSINITAENGELVLTGQRDAQADEDVKVQRIERSTGRFTRRFQLPDTADTDQIEAAAKNGVLTIAVPKKAQLQPRRIDVKVS